MKCTNKILRAVGFLLFIFIDTINGQGLCMTPSNEIGQCILLKNCEALNNIIRQYGAKMTEEQKQPIWDIWCETDESNQSKVCCPPLNQEDTFTPTDYSSHPNLPIFGFKSCFSFSEDTILLGNKTEPFQYPWMAIIQYKNIKNEIEQNCYGSIITLRFILTSAHCITLLDHEIVLHSVVVGEHNTKTKIDCYRDDADECAPPIQTILIDIAVPHPKFDKRHFTNDIGLLRLKSLIEMNDAVRRICLPITLQMQTQNLMTIIVTGWGKTEHSSPSDELLETRLPTIPIDECNRRYNERYRELYKISAINLCSLGNEGDSCPGGSGGPAFNIAVTPFGTRFVQYGVVSGGSLECDINYGIPGLYARVAHYIKWILDTCNE